MTEFDKTLNFSFLSLHKCTAINRAIKVDLLVSWFAIFMLIYILLIFTVVSIVRVNSVLFYDSLIIKFSPDNINDFCIL